MILESKTNKKGVTVMYQISHSNESLRDLHLNIRDLEIQILKSVWADIETSKIYAGQRPSTKVTGLPA